MMGNTANTADMLKIKNFDDLMEKLSSTLSGVYEGSIEQERARSISRATRDLLSTIQKQLNYVKTKGENPEGNFSELFKSKAKTPHTTEDNGNGNGNGRRKTARSIIN